MAIHLDYDSITRARPRSRWPAWLGGLEITLLVVPLVLAAITARLFLSYAHSEPIMGLDGDDMFLYVGVACVLSAAWIGIFTVVFVLMLKGRLHVLWTALLVLAVFAQFPLLFCLCDYIDQMETRWNDVYSQFQ